MSPLAAAALALALALGALTAPAAAQQVFRVGGVTTTMKASASVPGAWDVSVSAPGTVGDWLAVGFNSNGLMSPTEVVMGCSTCTGNSLGVLRYLLTGKTLPSTAKAIDVVNPSVSVVAGKMTLAFTASNIGATPIATSSFVVMAQGPVSGGSAQRHSSRGSVAMALSKAPTNAPVTANPTPLPTAFPTPPTRGTPTTGAPTNKPTQPTAPTTRAPTDKPTAPTKNPTAAPSRAPSLAPSRLPTAAPSSRPTSKAPSAVPTPPTGAPSAAPTGASSRAVLGGAGLLSWSAPDASGRVRIALELPGDVWLALAIGGPAMIGSHAVVGAAAAPNVAGAPAGLFSCVLEDKEQGCTRAYPEQLNGSYAVSGGRARLEITTAAIAGRALGAKDVITIVAGFDAQFTGHAQQQALTIEWGQASSNSTDTGTDSALASPTAGYIAHGTLMASSFLILYPAGALASVLRKRFPPAQWFIAHRYIQYAATLATTGAFAAVVAVSTGPAFASTHAKLGLALIAGAIVQPLLASSKAVRSGQRSRQPWRISHFVLAYLLFAGGVAACLLGIDQAKLYIKDAAALAAIRIYVYAGIGFLALSMLLITWNRLWNKWGIDEFRAAQQHVARVDDTRQAKPPGENTSSSTSSSMRQDNARDDNSIASRQDMPRDKTSTRQGMTRETRPAAHSIELTITEPPI